VTDVLVCVKRVPDNSGEILLTDDAQSVDARHVGFTVSAHEVCAVALAVEVAAATDGEATVLTLGPGDAVEQARDAVAVGCASAVLIEADSGAHGPADVSRAIAEVVLAHAERGRTYDLVLLGNDAADTGDFQVGARLGYELDRPVLTGISTLDVTGRTVTARGDGPGGAEVFEVPLPAVVTVMEGGVTPRYPSVPGRMKAKRATVETVIPRTAPTGGGRVRLKLPPAQPSSVQILGEGPDAAPAVVDLLERLGVLPT